MLAKLRGLITTATDRARSVEPMLLWRLLNRGLKMFDLMLVNRPPSAKVLREIADASQGHGRTVNWMREVADQADGK